MKSWWKSKVLWFNTLTIALVVLEMSVDLTWITAQMQQIIVISVAVVNALLRMVTTQPLTTESTSTNTKPPSLGIGSSGFTG